MRYTIPAFKVLLIIGVILSSFYASLAVDKTKSSCLVRSEGIERGESKKSELNGKSVHNNPIPVFSNEEYVWRFDKLNEASPIQLDFNDIVKRYIDVYSVRHRDKTARILGLSEIYFPIFEEYLDKYGLPLELKYIAVIESALNPKAKSRSGATGLWQFMFHASRMFDLKINSYVDERMDPVKSTDAACKYLQYLYRIFGDWQLTIAAYNGGPGVVRDAIKASGGKTNFWDIAPFLPEQTQKYLPAFIAVNYVMTYNQDHNIIPEHLKFSYLKLSDVNVKEPLSLMNVSKELDISIEDLRRLNPIYKLDFIPKSELPARLTLPVDKVAAFINEESRLYAAPQKKVLYHDLEKNMSSTRGKRCIVHIVQAGEFFHKIAMKYSCTSENIKTWNNLRGDILHIGQRLKVWVPVSQSSSNTMKNLDLLDLVHVSGYNDQNSKSTNTHISMLTNSY